LARSAELERSRCGYAHVNQILVSSEQCYMISDMTFISVDVNQTSTSTVDGVTVPVPLSMWEGIKHLETVDLCGCKNITDIGVSALVHGYYHLQTINITDCDEVTHITLIAVGLDRGELRSIDLSENRNITDEGISALSRGRVLLGSIELVGCKKIADGGVGALTHGCNKLQVIDCRTSLTLGYQFFPNTAVCFC
jgi:Leucine Rich repeat